MGKLVTVCPNKDKGMIFIIFHAVSMKGIFLEQALTKSFVW